MTKRVGIVAAAQTKYEASKNYLSISEMAYEVVEKVLQETGLKFTEDGTGIDATVSCSQDHWDGRTISGANVLDVDGGHHRPEEKVAADGAEAVCYGVMQILGGHYDIVLVLSHCQESHTNPRVIENAGFETAYQRLLGLDFRIAAALQAKRYMYRYGITAEQCARVVVKSYKNARLNPLAQEARELTVAEVLNSRMLAYPIRELDAKPVSDGACVVILASEEKAKKLTRKPVWIAGMANCYDTPYIGDRELADPISLTLAAKKAYQMAGIVDPVKGIDLAEISTDYSYQELLWCEGLGFCGAGEGGKLIDSGVTEIKGKLPVNPSGGVLVGNPPVVAGMARVAEAALQLSGKAGAHQIDGAKVALAHGYNGVCGQMHCVLILKN